MKSIHVVMSNNDNDIVAFEDKDFMLAYDYMQKLPAGSYFYVRVPVCENEKDISVATTKNEHRGQVEVSVDAEQICVPFDGDANSEQLGIGFEQ